MFLSIKIDDDTIAVLDKYGWSVTNKFATKEQIDRLEKFLAFIVEQEEPYSPNFYFSKGQEIVKAIKGAKIDYYLGQENSRVADETIY